VIRVKPRAPDRFDFHSLHHNRLTSAVDLVHLRYAAAAADHGSFRRAAEARLLRQSTLSRCIRQLEERIEMIVFERSSGGARATQAGDFLQMARSIPEQMDTLVASAHSAGRSEAGRLAIGFYTSLSAGHIRATLIDYAYRFPRVERSVACMRACKATTRRFFPAPEGDCDERSAAPRTRRIRSSEYPSREDMRCGG
jgi:Bacterial regulatory helix-turn-helix protein, lysR family